MAVYTKVCELVCHNPSCGIVNQDVESIGLFLDNVCSFDHLTPFAEIALEPDYLLGNFFAHLFFDCVKGIVNDLFGKGEDEYFADVVGEEGVGAAIAYAL